MKINFLFLLCVLGTAQATYAVDRLVADGGAGGSFASIMAAVNAAVSGDRIIVTPKAGGASWNENINLTTSPNNGKSLQFLSATEGVYWKLNGDITYTPSAAGQSLTVLGAHMISGSITSGNNAPAGARCRVVIMGCKLDNGLINFNHNYYDMNIAADSLMNGYIYFRYGKVVGNFIDSGAICAYSVYVATDAVASNDVVHIAGNKIDLSTSNCTQLYGVWWSSSSQLYNISNNYIKQNATTQMSIRISDSRSSATEKNRLMNNTCIQVNNNNWAIYVESFASYHQLLGNVIGNTAGTGGYGIGSSVNTNALEVSYNYTSVVNATNAFNNFTNDGTNLSGAVFTYDLSTGKILTGAPVNGGSPDLQYSDLDLSRNDGGCYGGSWSRENFLNSGMTGSQVTFFNAPGRVLVGNSISISGEGFDK